jgi:hypothetical protein
MANAFRIQKSNHTITSQSSGLVIDKFFIKHYETAANSLNEVAEGLMIALNLQNFWLMT